MDFKKQAITSEDEEVAPWDYCLIGMLLVSRSLLVEENAVEVLHERVFTCLLLSWRKISSPFWEINNVVVFLFPFHIFKPLTSLWFVHFLG